MELHVYGKGKDSCYEVTDEARHIDRQFLRLYQALKFIDSTGVDRYEVNYRGVKLWNIRNMKHKIVVT